MGTKLHIPYNITEFDDNMLVPLSRNFGEIQRHVAQAQADIESITATLSTFIDATNASLLTITENIELILEELSTST